MLALSLCPFAGGAGIVSFSVPSEDSASSGLASALSLGRANGLSATSNTFLWAPEASSFCLRAAGTSLSLPLSASLTAPMEEALPLRVSSWVDAEVRPCVDMRMSCMATSLSSSDTALPTVGSGVIIRLGPNPCPGGNPKLPRLRRVSVPGVAYIPDCG